MKKSLIILFLAIASYYKAVPPVISMVAGPDTLCTGKPSSVFSFTAFASNAPSSYNWYIYPLNTYTMSASNLSVTNVMFAGPTGIYTVVVIASNSSGSSQPFVYHVYVRETPSVTFTGSHSFCQGSSTVLMASSTMLTASPTLYYTWSPGIGVIQASPTSFSFNPGTSTNYTATISDGICSNEYNIAITVNPVPSFTAGADRNPMCSTETATVTITGNATTYSVNGSVSPANFTIAPTTEKGEFVIHWRAF